MADNGMDHAGNQLLYDAQIKLSEAREKLYLYGLERKDEQGAIAQLNFTIAQLLSAIQSMRRAILGDDV